MKVQCPHCRNVQNTPAQFCAKCGVQFVVKPIRPKVNQHIIAAVFGVLILGVGVISWFNGSKQDSAILTQRPVATSENTFITNQLKKDLVENYSSTSWYQNIKNISVKGNTIEVNTDLLSKSEKAGKICGGVSSLIYSYNGTTQNETIIVYDTKNNVLIRRRSIAEKCE